MEIFSGKSILYVWNSQGDGTIESQVQELKKIAKEVQLENLERVEFASYDNSTFEVIYVNVTNIQSLFDDSLKKLLSLVKPKGNVIFKIPNDENFLTRLLFLGFVNMRYDETNKWMLSEKPNYEIGSSSKLKLSFAKKPSIEAKKVWKIDMDDDDEDEEMINADDLLDEEDKQKPDQESLRVCATTGKRKACKDCSCGLAEELETESKKKAPIQKSSCGSCYLGDAFRCSSCPYMGMPAFKPNEKVLVPEMMKSDI